MLPPRSPCARPYTRIVSLALPLARADQRCALSRTQRPHHVPHATGVRLHTQPATSYSGSTPLQPPGSIITSLYTELESRSHLHTRHRAPPYRSLSKLPQREVVYEGQLRRGERERQVAVLRVLLVAVVRLGGRVEAAREEVGAEGRALRVIVSPSKSKSKSKAAAAVSAAAAI